MMSTLEKVMLRAAGHSSLDIFIRENKRLLKKRIRACQLWRDSPRVDIPISSIKPVDIAEEIAYQRRNAKPRFRDFVFLKEDETVEVGEIIRILWDSGEVDQVVVRINGSIKFLDGDLFFDYSSKGGRTKWFISP